MNKQMYAILFTLETAFHRECWCALRDNLLMVHTRLAHSIYSLIYTASKPIRLQENYLQYYKALYITSR